MSYAKRIVHLPTSYGHYLVALSSVAALAFALGVTTGPLGRRSAPTAAAPDQPRTASVERAPFETGWELYDGGWAGGPPPFKLPALVRVPDGLGWKLADDGAADGPDTSP